MLFSSSGVQRSGDAPGDCLIGCPMPNASIEQWHIVVIVTRYTLFVASQYDVISTFADQRFDEVCWHNMHIQGRRSSGRAGGAAKQWSAMETYKNNKIVIKYVFFCSSTMLTSKITTKTYTKSF